MYVAPLPMRKLPLSRPQSGTSHLPGCACCTRRFTCGAAAWAASPVAVAATAASIMNTFRIVAP